MKLLDRVEPAKPSANCRRPYARRAHRPFIFIARKSHTRVQLPARAVGRFAKNLRVSASEIQRLKLAAGARRVTERAERRAQLSRTKEAADDSPLKHARC